MKPVRFPSSDWNDVRNEVEASLRYLFRCELKEWGADRFYIAISADNGVNGVELSGGMTCRNFTERYRDYLGQRFTTHGPGMFIDTNKLGECTDESFNRFCGIAVHEMAHMIQERYPEGYFASIVEPPPPRQKRNRKLSTDLPPVTKRTEDQAKYGRRLTYWMNNLGDHQLDFIRPLIHVGARTLRHGWAYYSHDETFGFYVPGSFAAYELFLEDEISAHLDRSLNEIWSHNPPDKFTELNKRLNTPPLQWMTDITTELHEADRLELASTNLPAVATA